MADFLRDCNTGDLKTDPKTFTQTWCVRCSRKECSLAGFAKDDLLAQRNATWRERFFGEGREADISLPKFAQIHNMDFPNLLQKAMKLEISERRGDWSVPDIPAPLTFLPPKPKEIETDVPIEDGVKRAAQEEQANAFDEARRKLSQRNVRSEEIFPASEEPDCLLGEDLPADENEPPMDNDDSEPMTEAVASPLPVPQHPKSQKVIRPSRGNVPDRGEVMLGGAPAPRQTNKPVPETDPWAPPSPPKNTVIKSGARIQFGAGGTIKKVDE